MRIREKSRNLYEYVVKSIAFYPTFIAVLFFAVAVLMISLEGSGLFESLSDTAPYLFISSATTAQTFLGTVAGGILSLTVFSFTMIMLVINQASSIYSPRVVPGLISQRKHQIVLGFYVGTVIYALLILINVGREGGRVPGTSVFLALVFAISCLVLFVYFIHSISRSVQIEAILESIYSVTRAGLEEERTRPSSQPSENASPDDSCDWVAVYGRRTGYLQEIEESKLAKIAGEHDLTIRMMVPIGSYLLKDDLLFLTTEDLGDEALREQILDCFIYHSIELPSENYLFGFKQITEIALKAMSPGINDMGTAINAIDYLTDLFAIRMELNDQREIKDEDGTVRVILKIVSLEQVAYFCFSELRTYGRRDPILTLRLLAAVKSLLIVAVKKWPHFSDVWLATAKAIVEDAGRNITNSTDRIHLNDIVNEMEQISGVELPQLPTGSGEFVEL